MKARTALLAILLVAATVAAGSAAAAAGEAGKMTICHHPGQSGARTMEVPRSAWDGHRGHGDHEGACASAGRGGSGGNGGGARPVPSTPMSLAAGGEGRADGDASFRVTVRNDGRESPLGVTVTGPLIGEGRWTVDGDGRRCSIDGRQQLRCDFGDLPAGQDLAFRLRFDGSLTVCREVTVTLALEASNDATSGDDDVWESVDAGACSPLG